MVGSCAMSVCAPALAMTSAAFAQMNLRHSRSSCGARSISAKTKNPAAFEMESVMLSRASHIAASRVR